MQCSDNLAFVYIVNCSPLWLHVYCNSIVSANIRENLLLTLQALCGSFIEVLATVGTGWVAAGNHLAIISGIYAYL